MAQSPEVISHWHLLVDDFNTSALELYAAIETAVATREVPEVTISRVDWLEAGILSSKRTYLRVAKRRMSFDICAAPYGAGYFFSWWFAEQPPPGAFAYFCATFVALPILWLLVVSKLGVIVGTIVCICALLGAVAILREAANPTAVAIEEVVIAMPFIGPLYRRWIKPSTYYATDMQIMFQESIHRAVVESIDSVRAIHGLQALAPEQTRLTMRDILK